MGFRNIFFLCLLLFLKIITFAVAGIDDNKAVEIVDPKVDFVRAANVIQKHWKKYLYTNIIDILDSMVEDRSENIFSLEELRYGDVFMRINFKADGPLCSHSSLHMFKAVEDNMLIMSTLEIRAQDEPLPIGLDNIVKWNEYYPCVGKNIYANILDTDIRRDARKWFGHGVVYRFDKVSFEKLKKTALDEKSRLKNNVPLYGEFYNCNTFIFNILKHNGF